MDFPSIVSLNINLKRRLLPENVPCEIPVKLNINRSFDSEYKSKVWVIRHCSLTSIQQFSARGIHKLKILYGNVNLLYQHFILEETMSL